jgi:hypothetical protein
MYSGVELVKNCPKDKKRSRTNRQTGRRVERSPKSEERCHRKQRYPPHRRMQTTVATAPFRSTNVDTDAPGTELSPPEEQYRGKQGVRPLVLTSETNLIKLHKQLSGVKKQIFEFRNTSDGSRVLTKGTAATQTVKAYFENNILSFYTFYPKSKNPMKALIRHLPYKTPAKDIADGLLGLGL